MLFITSPFSRQLLKFPLLLPLCYTKNMNPLKNIFKQLSVQEECKKYHLPLWECPQFLFIVMGVIIVFSAVFIYLVGSRYIEDPLTVSFITLVLVAILFTIDFIITQSVEHLAEANRMKAEFISIATHELRSPLANLKWIIELLVSGKIIKDKKKYTEYLRLLKENIYRMQESVSDLLTISRIEASKLPLKERYFSITKLTEDLIEDYRDYAESSNVKVYFEKKEELPKIYSDPFQIKLVIENLLDNAIRYVDEKGRVYIDISQQKNHIKLSIQDTGIGIPPADQKYIFQKFFRARNVRRHQPQGSGLGLYLTKAIIKRLDGKIGFHSTEEKGSTFWFLLPINKEKK